MSLHRSRRHVTVLLLGALAIGLTAEPAPVGATTPEGSGGSTEMQGAAGRKLKPGITFASFDAVVAYGVQRIPKPKKVKSLEGMTAQALRDKELANAGKLPPTEKPPAEQITGEASPMTPLIAEAAWRPPAPSTAGAANAPVLGGAFTGITGGNPPDTNLAVGPHNIVVVANSGVRILSKAGLPLGPAATPALVQFFASVGPTVTQSPRAVFDPYISRFWVIAADAENNPPLSAPHVSRIFVALSATDDAAGGWTFFSLNMRLDGNTLVDRWCDHPMFGLNPSAVFFSCNMFDFPIPPSGSAPQAFRGAKVRTMTKSQFINGTCCLWWDTWNFHEGPFGTEPSFAVQPAIMFGAIGSEEFLVNAQGAGASNSRLSVRRITNVARCCISGNQQQPTWDSHAISVNSFSMPPDSSGLTPGIDTGDTRLQFATWQAGLLSMGQTTACTVFSDPLFSILNACVAFTQLDTTAYPSSLSIVSDWVFDPDDADRFYPAAAPNARGDLTMAYTLRPIGGPGAAYIGIPRTATCTSCVDGPETVVAGGDGVPSCTVGTDCPAPWGHYQGAAPDPDGTGIWVVAQRVSSSPPPARRESWVALTQESGDFTPPVTTASLSSASSDGDWFTSKPVTVTLTSTDAGVGPWKITYSVTQGAQTVIPTTTVTAASTSFKIQDNGEYVVTFYGTDSWGNVETPQAVTVRVDDLPKKIVFASTRDFNPNGAHELYVMNADGSNQVRLTYNDADDTQPAVDRRGRVFFASNRDGDYEIYRLDRSGVVTQLTHNAAADVEPAVRVDGSRVAFASDRSGNFEIYKMNANGSALSGPVNPSPDEDRQPDWSADGSRLAYSHDSPWGDPRAPNPDFDIYVTSPARFLHAGFLDGQPSWHPTRAKVAASTEDGLNGALDVVVFDVPTRGVSYLTSSTANDAAPTWSPHGGFIAFQTDRIGDVEIYRMTATGASPTNLSQHLGEDVEPDWQALLEGYGVSSEPVAETTRVGEFARFKIPFPLRSNAPYALLENNIIVDLPDGIEPGTGTLPGGDCRVNGSELLCALGAIEPGTQLELTAHRQGGRCRHVPGPGHDDQLQRGPDDGDAHAARHAWELNTEPGRDFRPDPISAPQRGDKEA